MYRICLTKSLIKNIKSSSAAKIVVRSLATGSKKGDISSSKAPPSSQTNVTKATGFSSKVLDVPDQPVGPCAAKDKEYKNPEYFCYHKDSFGESMVELEKYRLPAPSNKVKFVPPK